MRPAPARGNWLRDFDWPMSGLVAAICLIGLFQIYSSTINTSFHDAYSQHIVWLVLGVALYLLASYVDYHRGIALSMLLWGGGVALLIAVLLFTEPVNGARRWLPTPLGFSIQVSEFMKVVLVLVVAKCCSQYADVTMRPRDFAKIGLLFSAPVLLVLMQPDLSTALSMIPVLGMGLLLSKIRIKHMLGACLVGILLLPLAWENLKPYQKSRIMGFIEPGEAPRSTGYQILQSQIAVGSGKMWGQGFVQGSQTQLRFLPTPHTDFILASFAEERGFVGIAIVLGLYYALLIRIVRTGQTAADAEGTLIAMSVAALLLFHIVVNVGMVANKLPVTGLPLPLMSYGGSSLLTFMTMLGLVNNARLSRFVN